LNKSVSNININGISNNFVKLSNLIKTIKEDCSKQLTNFQATINKALVQKSQLSKENSVLQEDTIVPVVEEETVVEEHSVAENETVVEEKSVAENETVVEEKPVVEEEPVADEVSVVVNEDLFQLKNKTKSLDISMDVDNEKENIKISLEDENP
jgi:S-DNA-T family DNA segregation ATPase FtsK/SpoIIIE